MNEKTKELLVDRMTENLVVLRAKLGITQAELADIAGMSRQTILAIEKKQRTMTWNTFLSLLFIFSVNKNTEALLKLFEILTDELIEAGFVRELISKIQTQRKETGLEVTDRIILGYDGNEKLAQIISKNSEFLASEVLATEVKAGLGANTKEWTVNGEKITLSIEKA